MQRATSTIVTRKKRSRPEPYVTLDSSNRFCAETDEKTGQPVDPLLFTVIPRNRLIRLDVNGQLRCYDVLSLKRVLQIENDVPKEPFSKIPLSGELTALIRNHPALYTPEMKEAMASQQTEDAKEEKLEALYTLLEAKEAALYTLLEAKGQLGDILAELLACGIIRLDPSSPNEQLTANWSAEQWQQYVDNEMICDGEDNESGNMYIFISTVYILDPYWLACLPQLNQLSPQVVNLVAKANTNDAIEVYLQSDMSMKVGQLRLEQINTNEEIPAAAVISKRLFSKFATALWNYHNVANHCLE